MTINTAITALDTAVSTRTRTACPGKRGRPYQAACNRGHKLVKPNLVGNGRRCRACMYAISDVRRGCTDDIEAAAYWHYVKIMNPRKD